MYGEGLMGFRSLFSVVVTAGALIAGSASAQVLYCPEPAELSTNNDENRVKAGTLLGRLLTAFDLHGQSGIDQAKILGAHQATPGALLAKLSNIADRCSLTLMRDITAFHEELPDLRRAMLDAVLVNDVEAAQQDDVETTETAVDAEDLEKSINLSLRDLWRKLWFRQPSADDQQDHRWAVIVASPEGVSDGWASLRKHQASWDDVYFELHQPYYDDSDYHAIVVGKKLPISEAERLLLYVRELGMADDAYLWPVPVDDAVNVASTAILEKRIEITETKGERRLLDLSVLRN